MEVFSGDRQGSLFGSILFTIYINDLDDKIKSKILKFADDIMLTGSVDNDIQRQIIKENLTILPNWDRMWEVHFNIDKCKVMHIANSNLEVKYKMSRKGVIL